MAEAVVLRELILKDLKQNRPVMAMGDFNDSEHSVTAAIVSGERPFKNYSWMRRHNAKHRDDRYSSAENEKITRAIETLIINWLLITDKLWLISIWTTKKPRVNPACFGFSSRICTLINVNISLTEVKADGDSVRHGIKLRV